MSTEEMVVAIQGGNTALLEPLWGKLQRLVRKFAYRYYTATQGRGGVTVEDLEQAGFLAVMDAIPRYDPKEAAFSTYLVQYLRKHFQEASGRLYKDAKGCFMPKDALNTCVSLNMTVDDDEETELVEITSDPATNLESIEEKIWREQLRETVADVLQELPEDQMAVVRCRFWEGLTYEEAAKQLGRDAGSVRGAEQKAIRGLRKSKNKKRLLPFCDFNYYSGTGFGAFKSNGASIQERYVMRKEECENMFRRPVVDAEKIFTHKSVDVPQKRKGCAGPSAA